MTFIKHPVHFRNHFFIFFEALFNLLLFDYWKFGQQWGHPFWFEGGTSSVLQALLSILSLNFVDLVLLAWRQSPDYRLRLNLVRDHSRVEAIVLEPALFLLLVFAGDFLAK